MTSVRAMYYIHFEFIAKLQVDCIAAIAMSKIRIARRDSMPVFQECAEDGEEKGGGVATRPASRLATRVARRGRGAIKTLRHEESR